MGGPTLRKPEEEHAETEHMDLAAIRPVITQKVKDTLSHEQQVAQKVMLTAFNAFDKHIAESGNTELQQGWKNSTIKTLFGD